jgi:fructosamine-3-kinase
MISTTIQSEIEKEIHDRISSVTPLSTANNAQIYRLTLATNRVLVAKVAEHGLDTEAYMLKYLKEKTSLPVPAVYFSNAHVIAMEYIPAQTALDDPGHRHAAEVLAELHNVTADAYGHERDTALTSFAQPNGWTEDWVAFFVNNRLLNTAGELMKEGRVDTKFIKLLEKLSGKLPEMLKGYQKPGLVHGDVWGGNVLAAKGRVAAFLDPAIYYADPEVELAFIRLFNTFNSSFFSRYSEIRPIRPGFSEERADIYSLYPLMVHTRLFGPSYARKALKILEKYA